MIYSEELKAHILTEHEAGLSVRELVRRTFLIEYFKHMPDAFAHLFVRVQHDAVT